MPQFYNRYAYVQGSPMNYLDPNGECAVPAGLKPGQVGICIEAFIADDRIGGVGFGDNRGFQRNNPEGTARIGYKAIIEPETGTILRYNEYAGVTKAGLTEELSIKRQGTVETSVISAPTESGTRFSILLSGKNGFAAINRLGAIGVHADFTVDRTGGVTRGDTSATKGYPSVEGYAYQIVQGELVIQVLYRSEERTPSELDGPIDEPLTE